jgi:hypothetical protein
LKAYTANLKIDMYQKSDATLKVKQLVLCGLDNNASLTANKLTLKNADVTTESYSAVLMLVQPS